MAWGKQNDMARLASIFLISSMLLILPLLSNSEAFLQTSLIMEVHLNPGESQSFQWGLQVEENEEAAVIKLRAEGEGKELLSFPESIDAIPGVWNTVTITITIPEDYPTDVLLNPAVFALLEGKEGSAVRLNIQMKNVATIIIGNPVIEEVVEEEPQVEMVEEVEEEKPVEKTEQEPGTFTITSPEEKEGGGCLISTATFGSEMAPQVQMLREIRDNKLLSTGSGTAFMTAFNTIYYSFSPTIADLERQSPIFQQAVKLTITPLITSLSILNYVDMDSEAEVLGYGISLILLNVAMYFIAPAILITRLRR